MTGFAPILEFVTGSAGMAEEVIIGRPCTIVRISAVVAHDTGLKIIVPLIEVILKGIECMSVGIAV